LEREREREREKSVGFGIRERGGAESGCTAIDGMVAVKSG
jgi:hypothetical protein